MLKNEIRAGLYFLENWQQIIQAILGFHCGIKDNALN